MKRALLLTLAFAALAACGPTVGDPCTVPADCGGQVCITRDYAPGGYCTRACTTTDPNSCPGGTVCLADGVAKDTPGCFKVCTSQAQCRPGYVCKVERDSVQSLCIGPNGL
ncbi:MAG: hypothetical protein ACYC8T_03135 [Myxococcaceae bacterium]